MAWIALGVAIVVGLVMTQRVMTERVITAAPSAGTELAWLETLFGLFVFSGVGRILLSLLPAGSLGSFRPRSLATTWATSHLLGVSALGFTNIALSSGLGAPLALTLGRPFALVAPWLVVLVARVLSLPGAIVPGHEHTRERLTGLSRFLPHLFALAAALLLRAVWSAPATPVADLSNTFLGEATAAFFSGGSMISPVFAWASWIATVLLLLHGLETARRSPALRWAFGLALLLTPFAADSIAFARSEILTAMFFGGGAAFAVSWLRHGDRRSASLAVIAFLSQILTSWNGLSLAAAAIVALVICSPVPSRKSIALRAGALWLFVTWPVAGQITHQMGEAFFDWPEASMVDRVRFALVPANFGVLVPAFLLLGIRGWRARRANPRHPAERIAERPDRELKFAVLLLVLAFLTLRYSFLWLPENASPELRAESWANLAALIMLPVAALTAGLAAIRGERG